MQKVYRQNRKPAMILYGRLKKNRLAAWGENC